MINAFDLQNHSFFIQLSSSNLRKLLLARFFTFSELEESSRLAADLKRP